MNTYIKKFWYKIINQEKYNNYKISLKKEENIKIFKTKFEKKLNNIQNQIKNKNELSFLHSGHSGDIINALPVIKELSKTHKCNLYIQINKPMNLSYHKHPAGNVLIDERIFNLLLPLLKSQKYINCENQKRKITIFDFIIIIKCLF